MADTEWGWKKRSDDSNDSNDYDVMILPDEEETDIDKRNKVVHNSYYTPYR